MKSQPVSGLYEQVVTNGLRERLGSIAETFSPTVEEIDKAEAAQVLSRHFMHLLERTLDGIPAGPDIVQRQVQLCNQLVLFLAGQPTGREGESEASASDLICPEMLLALMPRNAITTTASPARPSFPLNETHLLVNARSERNIGFELEREIASADSIDLLCSFLLWTGYRQLRPALELFFRKPGAQMRIITTVYMGATQARVLDEFHAAGAQVRISYDTRRTRLHAKAWLLRRNTGYDTAFIGSSNLSAAALTEGLEWNVRVGSETPTVLNKFSAAFEGYWNDPSFEIYDPERDHERLRAALAIAKGAGTYDPTLFELRPYAYQTAILERLKAERELHGRFRNLVVAATGTGKTLIAAFDFRRLREEFRLREGRQPKLLFIAHRKEILKQARDAFRQVLRDSSFGELLVDGQKPTSDVAVFASVQSLSRIPVADVAPGTWDVVIVDEFHHAAAESYSTWLSHLTPWILLGLTATPERADGKSVLEWFGGHFAVELRLWDAIEQSLLAPFRYFALKDVVDLASCWRRDRRQLDLTALDGVFTGHHARAKQVVDAVREYVEDPRTMRAIGFCVSRGHARFMADQFERAGLRAATVLGDDEDRDARIRRLQSGELQALFTVDVLSEGVDIPEVDTALFLRPTDSATVFLQQLGRGLRLCEGKKCLTVLDLVASPDRDFRLERRFMSLLAGSRRAIIDQVDEGFPLLPPGCSIQLTDDVKDVVLASLRAAVPTKQRELIAAVQRLGSSATLSDVLHETELSLMELYRKRTLTMVRRLAGFTVSPEGPQEQMLAKTLPRLLGFDSVSTISEILRDIGAQQPPQPSPAWQLILVALFGEMGFVRPAEAIELLWDHPAYRQELGELLEIMGDNAPYPQAELPRLGVPLQLHCHYQRKQIETALTAGLRETLANGREGVWFVKERNLDVLFVQLRKSEKNFSPSTMYRDYAISMDRFHWQSQATTAADHKKGRRHIDHVGLGITPLLFARVDEDDERGETNPYLFLGPVTYLKHEGERPLNIEWLLEHPMPADFFEHARVAV